MKRLAYENKKKEISTPSEIHEIFLSGVIFYHFD